MSDRRQESYVVRLEAAELARSREYPIHKANGDEQKYAGDKYFMSFTKGLPHDSQTGLLHNPLDFVEFRRAIDDGFIDPFSDRVRHGSGIEVNKGKEKQVSQPDNFRQWEAPTAGVVFELEGPDAQAVTMPPAPPLLDKEGKGNPELALEMAEVYELAILRDKPFNSFESGVLDKEIKASIGRLNEFSYIGNQTGRPRKVDTDGKLDLQTVFRGSSPGVDVGPYLSQFLLIGNTDVNGGGKVAEGKITYGVLQIDQKVPIAKPNQDYMVKLPEYVRIQRGLRPEIDPETYVDADGNDVNPPDRPARRFISTPRDLATYVHYDALYEAYLNACIILLGMGTPFDPGFDHLSGVGVAAGDGATRRNAGGFALYGGPHILNLVTEVATRALKAVRFQKFNNHIRLRPEALAARIELIREPAGKDIPPALSRDIGLLKDALEQNKVNGQSTLDVIERGVGQGTYFLPMAFPEGSPMHPAYGAGHATVAGACVTILKAFFDTSTVLAKTEAGKIEFKRFATGDEPIAFRAPDISYPIKDDVKLVEGKPFPDEPDKPKRFLTLEGELNKLAANISIGRDMAGVHFFSDYYDSLRMGEEIAIGILEEQALTYSTDPFVLSLPTFDGEVVRIGRR
ncbi:MAG: vanadium-dependent haloperoxidase [Cyanobacteria bacterium P01_G01_bin.67]